MAISLKKNRRTVQGTLKERQIVLRSTLVSLLLHKSIGSLIFYPFIFGMLTSAECFKSSLVQGGFAQHRLRFRFRNPRTYKQLPPPWYKWGGGGEELVLQYYKKILPFVDSLCRAVQDEVYLWSILPVTSSWMLANLGFHSKLEIIKNGVT